MELQEEIIKDDTNNDSIIVDVNGMNTHVKREREECVCECVCVCIYN